MGIFNSLLVEILLFFEILNTAECFLEYVCRLLIWANHQLLVMLHCSDIIGHIENLFIEFLDLCFKLIVSVPFVHQIILHVTIHSIDIVFFVVNIINLCWLLHPVRELGLKVTFLSIYPLEFLMN